MVYDKSNLNAWSIDQSIWMVGIWFQLIYRISPSEKFSLRCINCKNLKLLSFEWWLRRWLSAVVICSLQDRISSCKVIPHWKPAQVDEYFSIQSYFWLRYVLMWIGQYKLINIEMDTVNDFPCAGWYDSDMSSVHNITK